MTNPATAPVRQHDSARGCPATNETAVRDVARYLTSLAFAAGEPEKWVPQITAELTEGSAVRAIIERGIQGALAVIEAASPAGRRALVDRTITEFGASSLRPQAISA